MSGKLVEDASMSASSSLLIGAASVFSVLVNLAVLGVFVVVILTVVRRHRPDAAPILVGAIAFELLLTCLSYVVSMMLPRFAMVGGVAGYAQAQAVNVFVFTLAHVAARGLLLWGIVRLARPPLEA